jgi:2-haloacid dehalogenase
MSQRENTILGGMRQFTDLKVCPELGVRSVWINRLGERLNPAWTPNAVLTELDGLPELLWSG